MTNKQYEVKEYLSSLRFAESMIRIKLEKIEETRELALRVNQALRPDHVQGGSRKNIVEEAAIKVADLTIQLEKQVDEYKKLQKNVMELINAVSDDTQRKVLELRYIHFMKWEKICDLLSYDRTWISRIHNRGIKAMISDYDKLVRSNKKQHKDVV